MCRSRSVRPTHVGMVRRDRTSRRTARCAPHARGDGPGMDEQSAQAVRCAPRTWGWSVMVPTGEPVGKVRPTHVGMVRMPALHRPRYPGAPHARGDGPPEASSAATAARCAPRTWGWSGLDADDIADHLVRPTHVGMVRRSRRWRPSTTCAPHARGDGPPPERPLLPSYACAPRTWGWSATITGAPDDAKVRPTHVGMVRPARSANARSGSAPHARGDGPSLSITSSRTSSCAPRTWGWSEAHRLRQPGA